MSLMFFFFSFSFKFLRILWAFRVSPCECITCIAWRLDGTLPARSPLSQSDVPRAVPVLQFSDDETSDLTMRDGIKVPATPSRPLIDSPIPQALQMSAEQIQNNPLIDYTTPDLVSLVISDVGILTPSVSLYSSECSIDNRYNALTLFLLACFGISSVPWLHFTYKQGVSDTLLRVFSG